MDISFEKILPLNTNRNFHFIILGCGGTGSALIPRFCALLSSMDTKKHRVSIFDGDIVEPKNLSRQGFFKADLGKNKAEVLGAKCTTAFDMEVNVYSRYLESKDDLTEICGYGVYTPFIIGCVDTNAVRRMLHEFSEEYGKELFWLDSGNEEFAGQVVLHHRPVSKPRNRSGNFLLPDVTYFFPDMLESKEQFASELSCAEHAVSHPQAAITNVTAATLLLQFLSACLEGEIRFHMVTFDAENAAFRTLFNYKSLIDGYKKDGNKKQPAPVEVQEIPANILGEESSPVAPAPKVGEVLDESLLTDL